MQVWKLGLRAQEIATPRNFDSASLACKSMPKHGYQYMPGLEFQMLTNSAPKPIVWHSVRFTRLLTPVEAQIEKERKPMQPLNCHTCLYSRWQNRHAINKLRRQIREPGIRAQEIWCVQRLKSTGEYFPQERSDIPPRQEWQLAHIPYPAHCWPPAPPYPSTQNLVLLSAYSLQSSPPPSLIATPPHQLLSRLWQLWREPYYAKNYSRAQKRRQNGCSPSENAGLARECTNFYTELRIMFLSWWCGENGMNLSTDYGDK